MTISIRRGARLLAALLVASCSGGRGGEGGGGAAPGEPDEEQCAIQLEGAVTAAGLCRYNLHSSLIFGIAMDSTDPVFGQAGIESAGAVFHESGGNAFRAGSYTFDNLAQDTGLYVSLGDGRSFFAFPNESGEVTLTLDVFDPTLPRIDGSVTATLVSDEGGPEAPTVRLTIEF